MRFLKTFFHVVVVFSFMFYVLLFTFYFICISCSGRRDLPNMLKLVLGNIVPDLCIQVSQFFVHLLPAFAKTAGTRLKLLLFAALFLRTRGDFSIVSCFKGSSFSSSTPKDVSLPLSHSVVELDHSLKIVCMSSSGAPPPWLSEDSVLLTILNCASSLYLNRTRWRIACTRTSAKNWSHRTADTNLLPLHWPLVLELIKQLALQISFRRHQPWLILRFNNSGRKNRLGFGNKAAVGLRYTQHQHTRDDYKCFAEISNHDGPWAKVARVTNCFLQKTMQPSSTTCTPHQHGLPPRRPWNVQIWRALCTTSTSAHDAHKQPRSVAFSLRSAFGHHSEGQACFPQPSIAGELYSARIGTPHSFFG